MNNSICERGAIFKDAADFSRSFMHLTLKQRLHLYILVQRQSINIFETFIGFHLESWLILGTHWCIINTSMPKHDFFKLIAIKLSTMCHIYQFVDCRTSTYKRRCTYYSSTGTCTYIWEYNFSKTQDPCTYMWTCMVMIGGEPGRILEPKLLHKW